VGWGMRGILRDFFLACSCLSCGMRVYPKIRDIQMDNEKVQQTFMFDTKCE
jgi:hypothetical protein